MQHVEVQRRFSAAPDEVWRVYTDHAGWKNWAGFQRTWLEREGAEHRDGTGAVRCFESYGVRAVEEILDFEPPKRMTYRLVKGGLPIRDHLGEVVFEPDGDAGTRVTWRCRFDSRIPGLGGVFRFFITRIFRDALKGLEATL